ncbi:hypothetical protein [Methylobacterium gnaphalii]|uniref:Uncharacterized protein n=1 Tax=Methylobacterium gnaphalii TaxID=1010610 RepID=A0A512JJM4_9HYPH|nr:hypothetical protein [Methylobacterium gnaphalii]GEP10148.1 hypothetical protein MGN01_19930 [Methylobacterium gnaphalii]GJD69503.1 hypothetical protein MMMDOFMJ_2434 [Methylobacterium gnaphalii]GLS48418.1 hypothetical protein GCM10007885_12620 [Methylobacterium gnaphalii]
MLILTPRGRASARSAMLAFGSVAGSFWLISLLAAMLIKAGHSGRSLTLDLAGVTTVLMVVFVLPAMLCAWRGWWSGVILSFVVGVVAVAGLIAFASA